MQDKNKLYLGNIEKLYPVFYKEPENVRDILVNCVREALEKYDWLEGYCKEGQVDDGNLVHCEIILPELVECASYKKYGTRYYPIDIFVRTYYGKEFLVVIEISASENHYERFATVISGYEKRVIATDWIEPMGIHIKDIMSRKCDKWEPENINREAM